MSKEEQMKILIIGDPHIQTTNIPEFNLFMEKLFPVIEKEKPNLCVCLGDVLHNHERIHTTAMNKAYEFFDKLRKYCLTYILVGNHDMVHSEQFLTENHWMNGMKEWDNIVIVDKVKYYEVSMKGKNEKQNYKFIFCPYVFPGRFIEALETGEDEWKDADVIFAHQEFHGCQMNAITSHEGDKWEDGYPYVISGHIHGKQKVGNNIYYPGSAMQHGYSESGKNIIAICEAKTKFPSIREVDLHLPRRKIIRLDLTEIENFEDSVIPDENTKIKLCISGSDCDIKSFRKTKKYKDLCKYYKIIFENKEEMKIIKNETEQETSIENFFNILQKKIDDETDIFLKDIHQEIINK